MVQIQIPSEPPQSFFSNSEDGPGWAVVMYFRITEDACNQLKDLSTASPAVKLFAEWCEKAPVDPAWRGRFKVSKVIYFFFNFISELFGNAVLGH